MTPTLSSKPPSGTRRLGSTATTAPNRVWRKHSDTAPVSCSVESFRARLPYYAKGQLIDGPLLGPGQKPVYISPEKLRRREKMFDVLLMRPADTEMCVSWARTAGSEAVCAKKCHGGKLHCHRKGAHEETANCKRRSSDPFQISRVLTEEDRKELFSILEWSHGEKEAEEKVEESKGVAEIETTDEVFELEEDCEKSACAGESADCEKVS